MCFLSPKRLTELIRVQRKRSKFLSVVLALQAHTFTSQALTALCLSHFICFHAS